MVAGSCVYGHVWGYPYDQYYGQYRLNIISEIKKELVADERTKNKGNG